MVVMDVVEQWCKIYQSVFLDCLIKKISMFSSMFILILCYIRRILSINTPNIVLLCLNQLLKAFSFQSVHLCVHDYILQV